MNFDGRLHRLHRFATQFTFLVLPLAVFATACSAPRSGRKFRQEIYLRKANSSQLHFPKTEHLRRRAESVRAQSTPIEDYCLNPFCSLRALDRFFQQLDEIDEGRNKHQATVLQLGDSHIAADLITGTIRRLLQERFGRGGRGFVVLDQPRAYGGRKLEKRGWARLRSIDTQQAGLAFGFSGQRLTSAESYATLRFQVAPEENVARLFFEAHPGGGIVDVYSENIFAGRVDSRAPANTSRTQTFALSLGKTKELRIVAQQSGTHLLGLSLEHEQGGLVYHSVGPVGSDAARYLMFDKRSYRDQIKALEAHLVILMLGGNDARAIRRKKKSLSEVAGDFDELIRRTKEASPLASCLLWGPLDTGVRRKGQKISTADYVSEVGKIQRKLAKKHGCAFWDALHAMGGPGSFGRWLKKGLMNTDLVHPRSKGGELLGYLFSSALLDAYLGYQKKIDG